MIALGATSPRDPPVDLLVVNAALVATVNDLRREIAGGWVAVRDRLIVAVGDVGDPPPSAVRVIDAHGCLVTPGLVNTHHHLFQNLTRGWPAMTSAALFDWMATTVPVWRHLDEEAAYASAWVGLAELLLSGCTLSSDMMYFHLRDRGDLVGATIRAARDLEIRFHPVRAAITTDGDLGSELLPAQIVWEPDDVIADSERLIEEHHQTGPDAMVQVAVGPCMTSLVGAKTTRQLIELAERYDVRLHTHLAESAEDDAFALRTYGLKDVEHFESLGLASPRTWAAHGVQLHDAEIARLRVAGVAIAHCPTSNLVLGSGVAPVAAMRAHGLAVGLGVDGSSSNDSGSLWLEARQALLVGKLQAGPSSVDARSVLEIATRGGAACLGRSDDLGQIAVGHCADLVVWDLSGLPFASGSDDLIELWLRGGPAHAAYTIVGGKILVEKGQLSAAVDEMAARLRTAGRRMIGQSR